MVQQPNNHLIISHLYQLLLVISSILFETVFEHIRRHTNIECFPSKLNAAQVILMSPQG